MTYWLKALGHAKWRLPDAWLDEPRRLRRTSFPRRPAMEPGDRLVFYASGWKRVFALVEVTAAPTDEEPLSERWPWSVEIEPLVVVPLLSNAPPVEALGIPPRSMSQQSHIRIGAEHYARAVEAITSVALA